MPIPDTTGAFAILPHNDLPGALPFWERLGFVRVGGDAQYYILQGWGCEVHLTQAGTGPWRVPEDHAAPSSARPRWTRSPRGWMT